MVKIKAKRIDDSIVTSIADANTSRYEYIAILDLVIRELKNKYNLSFQQALYMLIDFKNNTKSEGGDFSGLY